MFTPRELEVIRLIVEDAKTDKEVATALSISTQTVHVHRQNIMRKIATVLYPDREPYLQHVNLADLCLYAVVNHLVDMEFITKKYYVPAQPAPEGRCHPTCQPSRC